MTLQALVGDVDGFFAEGWQQRVWRNPDRVPDQAPLSLEDIDALLDGTALRLPYIVMSGGGKPVSPNTYSRPVTVLGLQLPGVPDRERVLRHLAAGKTLILLRLDDLVLSIRNWCRQLTTELGVTCDFSAYLTPPGTQALTAHADQQDAFIWQLHGRKRWQLWPRRDDFRRNYVFDDVDDLGEPEFDFVLEVGQAFYMPRGTPHRVTTVDSVSLHATVALQIPTNAEKLSEATREALTDGVFDVAWDGVVPSDVVEALTSRLATSDWSNGTAPRVTPPPNNQLALLGRLDEEGARWRLAPRVATWTRRQYETAVALHAALDGREIWSVEDLPVGTDQLMLTAVLAGVVLGADRS